MHEQRTAGSACRGDGCGRFGIDAERDVGIGFGLVHRSVGGGIHHDIRTNPRHQRGQCLRRVEIRHGITLTTIARGDNQLTQRCQAAAQFTAHLAIAAQQQQLHAV